MGLGGFVSLVIGDWFDVLYSVDMVHLELEL